MVTSMASMLSNPKYWELRAQEARVVAEATTDPEARRLMFRVIEYYELIARRSAIMAERTAVMAELVKWEKPP
jgi:hypothetical protein